MKTCTKCKVEKPNTEFYKDSQKSDGLGSSCKECHNKVPRVYNKTGVRKRTLKYKYGITLQQYEQLLLEQNSVCKICGGEQSKGRLLAVDHCHDSGKVRGLLCDNCNVGLGNFKDNPSLLAEAIKYLVNE